MKTDKPSSTAIFAALQRAAHQLLDDEPKILLDPLAVGLVAGSSAAELRRDSAKLRRAGPLALRSVFVFRSRFVEDELERAVSEGIRQLVLLGAGLDTFPYRQPAWTADLKILEVDHLVTQDYKRRRLAELGVPVPGNVAWCPLDFESTSLEAGLRSAGLDRSSATFFSWLGVTQYLTAEAVTDTLRFVLSSPRMSRLVFSFIIPEEEVPRDEQEIFDLGAASAYSLGEPWLSFFRPPELVAALRDLGFSSSRILSPREAQHRYFSGRADGLHAPTMEQMAVATV